MLRQLHYRCWVTVAYGQSDGHHHRSDQAAYEAVVGRLLDAGVRIATGLAQPDEIPIEDMRQQPRPCWTMRCSGCARQLRSPQAQHWFSIDDARAAADAQGWDGELELCQGCLALVIPLRRRTGPLVAAPAAG
jgi:hypothetical protein